MFTLRLNEVYKEKCNNPKKADFSLYIWWKVVTKRGKLQYTIASTNEPIASALFSHSRSFFDWNVYDMHINNAQFHILSQIFAF